MLDMLCLKHIPNSAAHNICKVFSERLIHLCCAAPVGGWISSGLVHIVASNNWSVHLPNVGSVAVTGFISISRTLLSLWFGPIFESAIENSKNNSQSSFWKFLSFIIISSNHTINSFGVHPPLLIHSTAA